MAAVEPDQNTALDAEPSKTMSTVASASILGLFFLVGGLFGAFGLQPVRFMAEGFLATRTLVLELTQTRPDLLSPIVHPGSGVVAHDPGRASTGLTLVQGLLPGGPQVRLIDMSGREIHRWNVDFFAAWDMPSHVVPVENIPKSPFHYHTQGFAVRPDGSLLVNIGDKGAVYLDKCGEIVWTVDRMTHHAVRPAPDGGYWLPAHKPIDQIEDRLLPVGMSSEDLMEAIRGRHYNPENTILKIDGAGRPEKEFSVLKAVFDAGLEAAIHDGRANNPINPTHLHDIVIVTPALAERIPGAEEGDLLVSLRTMNMLAILDQNDGSLKWHKRGPWVRQHDPDITPDGFIELFNNRSALGGYYAEGSQILRYDPRTDEVMLLHPIGGSDAFRSYIMGAHQSLPNGNRLIVESILGRVFEVTPEGDIVWSYVLSYDATYAALIENAERVPEDFFTIDDWTCS